MISIHLLVGNKMLAVKHLRVSPMQYGDLVYFTASGVEPEQVWTKSIERSTDFALHCKSTVRNPISCLFRIDAVKDSEVFIGQTVRPGTTFQLVYVLTKEQIGWAKEGLIRRVKLPNDEDTETPTFSLLVSTQRPNIGSGVVDEDLVTVQVNGPSHGGVLGHDFYVRGNEGCKWVIHRFEVYSKEDNELRFGRPYKLKANNGLFLSVLPNFKNSATLFVPEDQQSEETLPEYNGELRADLTSDQYDANNVWIIENSDRFLGGVIHSAEQFFLKHVGSNKYLSGYMTLVEKGQAKPLKLLSIDGEGSLCYAELSDLVTFEESVVSLDLTPSYELCKTSLFGESLTSLPQSTVLRHQLKGKVVEGVTDTLKFEVHYIHSDHCRHLLWLAMQIPPLVKLRTALQHTSTLASELELLANNIDLLTLRSICTATDLYLGNALGDFQLQNELLRIYFLILKYNEKTCSTLTFTKTVWDICINWQYFERVKGSLLCNKEAFLGFLTAMPSAFATILQWGLRTYPPSDDARRYWVEVFARPDFTHLSLFDLTEISIPLLFNKLADRLVSPLSRADWLIDDERMAKCLDGDTLAGSQESTQKKAEIFISAIAANLAQNPVLKQTMNTKLGLCTDAILLNYRSRPSPTSQTQYMQYIAKVVVPEECGSLTISEFTENVVVPWGQFSLLPSHPLDWFFFPSPNSPLKDLVKDEVYFWLSTTHDVQPDEIESIYALASAHMRFVEELIEHNAVSDIFVASMMLSTAALARSVLEQPIPGFSNRFPSLENYPYRTDSLKQAFLESFLELVDTYQRWKKLKVLQRIATQSLATVIQTHLNAYLGELALPGIVAAYTQSADLVANPHSSDLSEGQSPLLEALKVIARHPLCILEGLLIHIFKETHYQCKRRPEYLLELIDREADLSRHLHEHLQALVEVTPYADFLVSVKELAAHSISSYELERNPATAVPGFETFLNLLSAFSKQVHSLSDSQEASDNLRTLLSKLSFERILETLWFNCTIIGSDFLEDSLYIEFRSLVFSLTRFFITNSPANRKKVLKLLPVSAFFPDYPEYILLLRELGFLESLDSCSQLAQAVMSFVGITEARRPILALKELLRDPKYSSQMALTLISDFRISTKKSLTGAEWEALALTCSFIPRTERSDLLEKAVERWRGSTQFAVKTAVVQLLILREEKDHIGETLTVLEPFFHSLLERNAKDICTVFSLLSQENGRNTAKTSEDLAFVLETIWSSDMLLFLGKDPTFCHFLMSLYTIISQDPACASLSSLFLSQTAALLDFHRDKASSEELLGKLEHYSTSSLLQTEMCSTRPFPLLQPFLQVVFNSSPARKRLLEKLLADTQSKPPVTKKPKGSSENRAMMLMASPLMMRSGPPALTHAVFESVQKWFLERKIEIDYLVTCEIAGNLIDSRSCKGQEMVLTRVIEGFLSLAVDRDEEVKKQALEAVIAIVRKAESTREFVLEALKKRRRYLQLFGPFQDLVRERIKLKKAVEKDQYDVFYSEKLEKVNSAIEAYLRLFQYCCDGCYFPFQEFLRDQGDPTSINVISLTAELLAGALSGCLTPSEAHLRETAGLMLVEALTGPNPSNQQTVCSTVGFLEAVQDQVRAALYASNVDKERRRETSNILKVIYVCLEGRERNWPAIREVMASVNFETFKQLALQKAQSLDKATLRDIGLGTSTEDQKGEFDFAIQCMQVCFLALEDLQTFRSVPLAQFLALVEIQESEDCIRCISFPIPSICRFLTSETALKLLFEIDRESRQIKLDDFTSKLPICLLEMNHQQAISQLHKLKLVTRHWKTYWEAAFFLVVLINIVLILAVVPSEESRFNMEREWHWVLTPLSILQVLCAFLGIFSYYIEYFYTLKASLKERKQTHEIEELPTLPSPGSVSAYLTLHQPQVEWAYDWQEVLKALLRAGNLVLSCVAVWYPYLYPILLFQIVNLNDSVVTILRSVTERWSQLVLTFLFALITIYGFTVVAYFFLYSYYSNEEGLYCDSLLDCFLSTVNLGMRSGGGIGDAYGPTQLSDFHLRWVFDLLFFILITTILMAIVFGIIVDTFSELRDERNEREFDMNNICFICGKSRSVIELKGEGWQTHTLFTHNPFAYLYFLIYIRGKDSKDCTGIEKTTKEQLEAGDISFYPATSRQLGFDLD